MKYFYLFCAIVLFSTQPVMALPSLSAPSQEQAVIKSSTQKESAGIFAPIQRQITKWSIVINREIPKRMKKLKNNPSWPVVMASILAAFVYGVLHTLGPGHGKMVVASYFLSHGAHFRRGAWVGAQVALSHVGGAVLIVLLTNLALKQVLTQPEMQVFWVKVVSYSLIMLIGVYMAVQAVRKLVHKHESVHSCGHCALHSHSQSSSKETLLSWAVGAVPCTGSLLILVYAMAYDVLWLGFFMVMCIALGMAMTMTLIGVLCITGKKHVVDKFSGGKTESKLPRWIELCGALAITFVGFALLGSILGR
ncbi:MAG: hypothetical protein VXY83_04360 [Pseudomonadota bacterium]|nr:hypothetical protein [Pseudomonadota bacterium]MEC8467572.1 hypothetical protein [Pseudomonadota bacterium]